MGTYPHVLKAEKAARFPSRAACLSVVPKITPVNGRREAWSLSFGAACGTEIDISGENYSPGKSTMLHSPGAVLSWIERHARKRVPLSLFTTDAYATLAYSGIWAEAFAGRWQVSIFVKENPPAVFGLRSGERYVIVSGLENYWNESDHVYATSTGRSLPRQPVAGAASIEIMDYAEASSRVYAAIASAWLCVARRSDVRSWACSVGGIGWDGWLRSDSGDPVNVHDNPHVHKLERAAYYGGRADCHIIGSPPLTVWKVDVNSLYPAMASQIRLPVSLVFSGASNLESVKSAIRSGLGVIAACQVESTKYEYPYRRNGLVNFATGKFATTLAGPELEYAIQSGDVRHVGFAAAYELGNPIGAVMEKWYDKRLSARKAGLAHEAALYKGMLVSLIGRFARKYTPWTADHGISPAAIMDCWVDTDSRSGVMVRRRHTGSGVEREGIAAEGTDSFVALTCFVNAAGRVYMSQLKELSGAGQVFYEDADCLHLSETGYTRLVTAGVIDEDKLGFLKTQEAGVCATYYGVRDYEIDRRAVKSGLPLGSVATGPGAWSSVQSCQQQGLYDLYDETKFRLNGQQIRRGESKYRGRVRPDGSVTPLVYYEDNS
jgi:hypothetical protein